MINLLGIHLTLLIGPTVPLPAPIFLSEALESAEVTHSDEGRSGFQLTFKVGRSGPADILDYNLLSLPLLRPFNRVILVVTFNATPRVLMDGIITHQQLNPSNEPGGTKLTVTGEDVSVMMDMEEKNVEHPAQAEALIATLLILSYSQYGMLPKVIPPSSLDQPIPIERTPVQRGTDLSYLNEMAGRYSYVFYVAPGPLVGMNIGYWGPPERLGIPQKALSVNMGPETNVESINFQYNSLAPTTVSGEVLDRQTSINLPIQTFISTRPPLVSQPALPMNFPNIRNSLLKNSSRLNFMQAFARAQAQTDKSTDGVVAASGELDALRYGNILQPRGLVGLRGAGYSYDGFYYVKRVSHKISLGEYKQSFSLTREGVGAISPVVIP